MLKRLKEIYNQMELSWKDPVLFSKIIERLVKKLASTKSICPGCFEYLCNLLDSGKEEVILIGFNEKEIVLSFIEYYIFMKAISNISDLDMLKNLIPKGDKIDNFYLERIVLYCFKNTKRIKWNEKSKLFWEWEKNPVLFFWRKKDPFLIPISPLGYVKNDICYREKIYYKYPEIYFHSYLLNSLVLDSYLLLKGIPELQKEVKEKDTIFSRWENEINKLNEKVYLNFWRDEKEKEKLIKLILLAVEAKYWNESLSKKLIIHKNIQKNEELWVLCWLLCSIPEVYSNIGEILKSEAPDFVLIAKDGKKIAVELTGIDSLEEVKKELKGEEPKVFRFDPYSYLSENYKKFIKAISQKINKYDPKKYSENWLILHTRSSSNILKYYTLDTVSKFNPHISEIRKQIEEEIKINFKNWFQKIYFCFEREIKEVISGQIYQTEEEMNFAYKLFEELIKPDLQIMINYYKH
ncbi:hypothetical protein V4D30_01665 [Thermodesulfovibrio sp. 3907-1M]|uniref:Uncharacterized protein n=1 Tax=Thermodesulfovibrio autotrophicus TaxID=3118333 RepID=A0AAU8GY55_9BACT